MPASLLLRVGDIRVDDGDDTEAFRADQGTWSS